MWCGNWRRFRREASFLDTLVYSALGLLSSGGVVDKALAGTRTQRPTTGHRQGETAADADQTRTGRGPHDKIQRNRHGPDADVAVSPSASNETRQSRATPEAGFLKGQCGPAHLETWLCFVQADCALHSMLEATHRSDTKLEVSNPTAHLAHSQHQITAPALLHSRPSSTCPHIAQRCGPAGALRPVADLVDGPVHAAAAGGGDQVAPGS
eukprot:gene14371-biopygen21633